MRRSIRTCRSGLLFDPIHRTRRVERMPLVLTVQITTPSWITAPPPGLPPSAFHLTLGLRGHSGLNLFLQRNPTLQLSAWHRCPEQPMRTGRRRRRRPGGPDPPSPTSQRGAEDEEEGEGRRGGCTRVSRVCVFLSVLLTGYTLHFSAFLISSEKSTVFSVPPPVG